METVFLTVDHIQDVCFVLARDFFGFDEPIPEFRTRFPGKLESALQIPQHGSQESRFYPTLPQQAAVLFYSFVKDHPFLNGNKRIAVVSLLVFLQFNGHWLKTDWKTLYGLTVFVANSDPTDRDKVLGALSQFIQNCLVKLDE